MWQQRSSCCRICGEWIYDFGRFKLKKTWNCSNVLELNRLGAHLQFSLKTDTVFFYCFTNLQYTEFFSANNLLYSKLTLHKAYVTFWFTNFYFCEKASKYHIIDYSLICLCRWNHFNSSCSTSSGKRTYIWTRKICYDFY